MRLAKSARLCIGAMLVALFAVSSLTSIPTALAWFTAQSLPNIPEDIRQPKLAAEGTRFHLIFEQATGSDLFYSRGTAAADGRVTWENPRQIANDVPFRYGWDIAADETGTVHVTYISADQRVLYTRNPERGDVGSWSSPEVVIDLPNQANGLEMTLDADRVPYVVWGQGVDPSSINFAYRSGANSWETRRGLSGRNIIRTPAIAVSGSGATAIVHLMYELQEEQGDSGFQVGYTRGVRDGPFRDSNFSQSFNNTNGDQPTIAVDRSNNVVYAGYVAGSISGGYYTQFTYSTTSGESWAQPSRLRLGGDLWSDRTPLVPGNGTVFILLPAKKAESGTVVSVGFYDVRFNFASKQFTAPVAILDYNGQGYKNVARDYALNEIAKAATWVTDFISDISYNSDPGGITGGPNATLVINNGATLDKDYVLDIELRGASGDPTQMRVAIDGDPTDSTPLEAFKASFQLTVPAANICERTVAVELLDADGLKSQILRSKIVIDATVQAGTIVGNPYRKGNAAIYTLAQDDVQIVTDGDRQFTRKEAFYVEVNGGNECSSLTELRIGRSAQSLGSPFTVGSNFFANVLSIPGQVVVGPNQIVLQVSDTAGNTQLFTDTIYYDPSRPELKQKGSLQVTAPTSGPNILTTLTFNGSDIDDNMYPGRAFWGVWLANSRTQITNPISDTTLVWNAMAAPGPVTASNFTLNGWNVLTNIPTAQQTPGDYYIYARFLDGAGNATTGFVEGKVTLTELTLPSASLTLVVK